MRKRLIPVLSGLALLAAVLGGCGGDSTGPSTSADLSGQYSLTSLSQGGITLGPPAATGTLVLTTSTYSLTLTTPDGTGGTQQTQDAGTYTAKSDGTWTQSSNTNGIQSEGTYTLSNKVLTVSVTTAGFQVSTVWTKQ